MNAQTANLNVKIESTFNFPAPFQTIRSHYGASHCDSTWASLERGRAILSTTQQAEQFLYSFGNMHEAKMQYACSVLHDDIDKLLKSGSLASIDLIDYGCGQGLASIVALDFLNSIDLSQNLIGNITLIEPSSICLNRAQNFIGNNDRVTAHKKMLDEITSLDLATNESAVKFHLFSNILDMGNDAFDIGQLASNIKSSQKGFNYFLCVSPAINNEIDERLALFVDHFKDFNFELFSHENDFLFPDRLWTINIWVFKVEL